MIKLNKEFYAELRKKIDSQAGKVSAKYGKKTAGWLFVLPDLMALCVKLAFDPRLSSKSKGLMGIAILYVISPIDLIPELFLGPGAYIDDLAIVILALQKVKESQRNPNILRELWTGDGDIIKLIEEIAGKVNELLDEHIIRKLKAILGRK